MLSVSTLQTRIVTSHLTVLVGVLAVCSVTLFSFWQTEKDATLLNHTHDVLRQVEITSGALNRAKAGQRGYLLTGNTHYRDRYFTAVTDCRKAIGDLRRLTKGDNQLQQQMIEILQTFIDEKLLDLAQPVRRLDAQATIPPAKHRHGDTSHSLTEQIDALLGRIAKEQEWYLHERVVQKRKSAWFVWGSAACAVLCIIIVLVHITYRTLTEFSRRQQMEAALRASRAQFAAFMDHSPAIAFIKDVQGRIQYVNTRSIGMWDPSATELPDTDNHILWASPLAEQSQKSESAVFERRERIQIVQSLPLPSGEVRHFYSVKFPFCDQDGKVLLGAMAVDITGYQQAADEREMLLAQRSALLDSVAHALFGVNGNGKCTFINERAAGLLGYSVEECMHSDMVMILRKGFGISSDRHEGLHSSVLSEGKQMRDERLFTRPDGTAFWMGYQARPVSSGSQISGAIITFADITDKRHNEERLAFQATHDGLTGLANRKYFHELLYTSVTEAKRHDMPLTLCICDVDMFKQVNDTYGHLAGDEVLATVGQVLQEGLRRGDVVGRLGGDEFCLLFRHTTADQACACLERIRERLETMAFGINGARPPFSVTATFGVAEMTCEMEGNDVMEAADAALYAAKRTGRNKVMST